MKTKPVWLGGKEEEDNEAKPRGERFSYLVLSYFIISFLSLMIKNSFPKFSLISHFRIVNNQSVLDKFIILSHILYIAFFPSLFFLPYLPIIHITSFLSLVFFFSTSAAFLPSSQGGPHPVFSQNPPSNPQDSAILCIGV